MSATNLIRWSGLALIVGGSGVAGFLLALIPIGGFSAAPAQSPGLYFLAHGLHTIGAALAALGLVGLYARQSERAGWLGLVGFVLAFVGTTLFTGLGMISEFIMPQIFAQAPTLVAPGGPLATNSSLIIPLTFVIFLLGYVLLGIATMRAGVLPRGSGLLLIVAALLFALPWPWPVSVAGALVYAAGMAWIGVTLWLGQAPQLKTVRSV
jgi:hypothetical protein